MGTEGTSPWGVRPQLVVGRCCSPVAVQAAQQGARRKSRENHLRAHLNSQWENWNGRQVETQANEIWVTTASLVVIGQGVNHGGESTMLGEKSGLSRNLWARFHLCISVSSCHFKSLPTSLHHRRRMPGKQYFTDFLAGGICLDITGMALSKVCKVGEKDAWKKLWQVWASANDWCGLLPAVLRVLAAGFGQQWHHCPVFLDLGPLWLLLSANGRCKQGSMSLYSLYPIPFHTGKQQQQQQLLFS